MSLGVEIGGGGAASFPRVSGDEPDLRQILEEGRLVFPA